LEVLWSLVLWCGRYPIENSEELQTNREPLDGSQTPFDTLLQKKKNPLYTGLIERITSTTFTRRMVGSCEPLSYAVSDTSLSSPLPSSFPSLTPTLYIHDSGPCNNDTHGHACSFKKLVFERIKERKVGKTLTLTPPSPPGALHPPPMRVVPQRNWRLSHHLQGIFQLVPRYFRWN
jgi:hypothetical protein